MECGGRRFNRGFAKRRDADKVRAKAMTDGRAQRTAFPMNKLLLLALPALALAACNSADTGPKTPEQAAAEMKKAVKMTPGKWQTTMTITKFDMPGAPPEAAQAMKGMMGKPTVTESCLTKEEADKDPADFIKKGQGDGCTFERFAIDDGKLDGKMVCDKGPQGKMEATMNGTLGAEAMSMTMNSTVSDAKMPGGKAEMGMTMAMKRIGACG